MQTNLQLHDFMSSIKNAPLDGADLQTMIDVLLNRQLDAASGPGGGQPRINGGWVDPRQVTIVP